MSETDKEALRLLNERMCAKVNDGRTILAENVADMLIAIRDLAAERDALQARVAELEGALEPFSNAAGAFFAKNGEKGDIIYDGGPMRSDCIFGEDLFAARQALKENQDD